LSFDKRWRFMSARLTGTPPVRHRGLVVGMAAGIQGVSGRVAKVQGVRWPPVWAAGFAGWQRTP
jgi:hypothetical protein